MAELEARVILRATDLTSPAMRQMGRSLTGLGAQFRRLSRDAGLMQVAASMRNLRRSVGGLVAAAAPMGRALRTMTGVGAVGGVAGLAVGLRSSSRALDQFAKSARDLGMPVQTLREFTGVAEQSGIGVDQTRQALLRANRTFTDLRAGIGRTGDAINRMGYGDLADKLKNAENTTAAVGLMLDAINQAERQDVKLSLAERLFGTTDMTRMALPTAEFQAAMDAMGKTIGHVTDEQAAAVERANDAWDTLRKSMTSVADATMIELAPAMMKAGNEMAAWVVRHRNDIAPAISNTFKEVGAFFRSVDWVTVAAAINKIAGAIDSAVEGTVGWKAALYGLGGLAVWRVMSGLIRSVGSVGKDLFNVGKAVGGLAGNAAKLAPALGALGPKGWAAAAAIAAAGAAAWWLTGKRDDGTPGGRQPGDAGFAPIPRPPAAFAPIPRIVPDNARALGGPVRSGEVSLVGERGPELVRWARDGMVMPAGVTRQALAGQAGNDDAPGGLVAVMFAMRQSFGVLGASLERLRGGVDRLREVIERQSLVGAVPAGLPAMPRLPRGIGGVGAARGFPRPPRAASPGTGASGAPGAATGGGIPLGQDQALAVAMQFYGAHERAPKDRATLARFFKENGYSVDPAVTAWCAAFVGSALGAAGIKDTGSLVANSYLRWGEGVAAEAVRQGDVLVEHRGRGAGQTGGHVGFATGKSEMRDGRLFLERVSGNQRDSVMRDWVRADRVAARRKQVAPETAQRPRWEGIGAAPPRDPVVDRAINDNRRERPELVSGLRAVGDGLGPLPLRSGGDLDIAGAMRSGGGGFSEPQKVELGSGKLRVEIASDLPLKNPSVSYNGPIDPTLAIDNTGAMGFRAAPVMRRNVR
jgi:uncharacterized protein (TIGR02594 family)